MAARLAGLLLLVSCDTKQGLSEPAERTDFSSYASQFIDRTHSLLPHLAVGLGRHEFDGVQTNFSPDAIALRVKHFEQALLELKQFNLKDVQEAYERDLLLWFAGSRLFALQQTKVHQTNIASYFAAISPDIYVSRNYAKPHEQMRALVNHTRNLPNLIRQLQENLATPLPKPHIELALAYFAGMVEYYEDVIPEQFARVEDVNLHQQLGDASLAAVHAFRNALVWLQAQQANAQDNFRLGELLFRGLLQQVHQTQMTLAQFKSLGEEDLARNRVALEQACTELDANLSLNDCLAKVAAHKPEQGAVVRAREQLEELRQFVVANDLVTIPAADLALVDTAPPHRRSNFAYIDVRGPYESGQVPSTYYVAPPDPRWSAADQLAYAPDEANLMFVSAHEVWPGHFLHGLHLANTQRPLRAVVRSIGFMEGWAHYAEEMIWEAGFRQGEPMMRIGQLQNALLRNVRYLCSYGLHVESMSTQTCEQMFVEQAFQNPAMARQQAARGTYDPNYFSYSLHKLLIRQLRDKLVTGNQASQDWKAFHDRLLALGAPPAPLAARYLLPAN